MPRSRIPGAGRVDRSAFPYDAGMHTVRALLDLHERTHRCVAKMLEHCAGFDEDALHRAHAGFGYETVRLQLHHQIGAEQYWIDVLEGRPFRDDEVDAYPDVAALVGFREQVFDATAGYLGRVSDADVNAPTEVTQWNGEKATVVPALVILRTQTHHFHHMGQVAAMCRALDHPVPPGMDFPLA